MILLASAARVTEFGKPKERWRRIVTPLENRGVINRRWRNQPPQLGFAHEGRDDRGRFQQRDDTLNRSPAGEREVAALVSERQPARQVAVEAREPGRRRLEGRAGGAAGEVHEREIVIHVPGLAVLALPGPGVPEGLRLVPVRAVAERVQRLEAQHLP